VKQAVAFELKSEENGLYCLSVHDCRHYWASQVAKDQTPLPELLDAGGWNSVAMPMRYIEKSQTNFIRILVISE
jgi:hypothetical protein